MVGAYVAGIMDYFRLFRYVPLSPSCCTAVNTSMRRLLAASAKSSKKVAVRHNSTAASTAAEEAAAEKVLRPKPSNLPDDGTVVYRKGVPIRGKLSKLPLKEKLIICFVFSITGSSAVMIVRPTLKYLVDNGFMGLPTDAGFWNGPWLYRCLYFAVMWPTYSMLLFFLGGIFGRRIWFCCMLAKMWGRFLPKRGKEYLKYVLDVN